MRWSVESWDPAYGLPGEALELETSEADVVVDVEVAAGDWEPREVEGRGEPPARIVFVDGVRRVDARAWIHGPDGTVHPAICATFWITAFARGSFRCERRNAIGSAPAASANSSMNDSDANTFA